MALGAGRVTSAEASANRSKVDISERVMILPLFFTRGHRPPAGKSNQL